MSRSELKPRLLQLPDVLHYMGVKKQYFNKYIRKQLSEIKFGYRTIFFELAEIDAYIDNAKREKDHAKRNCQAR